MGLYIRSYNLDIIIIFFFSVSSNKYILIYKSINKAFLLLDKKIFINYIEEQKGKIKRTINKRPLNLVKN